MKKLFLVLLLAAFSFPAEARPELLDVLKAKAANAKDDSTKLVWLLEIVNIYNNQKDTAALRYAREGVLCADRLGKPKTMGLALCGLGIAQLYGGNYKDAEQTLLRSLKISKQQDDRKVQLYAYNSLGATYSVMLQLSKAIEAFQQCLVLLKRQEDNSMLADVHINLAQLYIQLQDTVNALGSSRLALAAAEEGIKEIESRRDIDVARSRDEQTALRLQLEALKASGCSAMILIAEMCCIMSDYNQSLGYARKALAQAREIRDPGLEMQALNVAGKSWHHPGGDLQKAADYYQQALALARKIGDPYSIMYNLAYVGMALDGLGNYKLALEKSKEALAMAVQLNETESRMQVLGTISGHYKHLNNYKMADSFYRQHIALQDSMRNMQRQRDFGRQEERFVQSERILSDSLKHAGEKQMQALSMQRQRVILYSIIALTLVLAVLGVMLYRIRQVRRESALKTAFNKRVAEVEMQALRAQMNPHFIFNCLTSINKHILQSDHITASGFLTKFSRLIRLILDNSATQTTTLASELQLLRLYMELEALRYDNHFTWELEVDEELRPETLMVPSMIVQPYIENAIWHGLMHQKKEGLLKVQVKEYSEALLEVVVEDNGIGREKSAEIKSREILSHKSYGMRITNDRLQIISDHYHTQATVNIEDLKADDGTAAGTKVILHIPCRYIVN